MGRHAAPGPVEPERFSEPPPVEAPSAHVPAPVEAPSAHRPPAPEPRAHTWRDRIILSGAAAVTIGAVTAWAGAPAGPAAGAAVGGGIVVAAAAWVASTVPPRPDARSEHDGPKGQPSADPDERQGNAVQ